MGQRQQAAPSYRSLLFSFSAVLYGLWRNRGKIKGKIHGGGQGECFFGLPFLFSLSAFFLLTGT
jgi:hypothetical protein